MMMMLTIGLYDIMVYDVEKLPVVVQYVQYVAVDFCFYCETRESNFICVRASPIRCSECDIMHLLAYIVYAHCVQQDRQRDSSTANAPNRFGKRRPCV